MKNLICFTDTGTNFYEIHKETKPYQVVPIHDNVVIDFTKQYIKLYKYFVDNISEMEKDIIKSSVLFGVVQMEREPVKSLSQNSLVYLRELQTMNNNFLQVAFKTKESYRFPKATSYKRVLGDVKKQCLKELTESDVKYFSRWFSKYSPSGYLGKTIKQDNLKKPEPEPLQINYGYYSALFGRLFSIRHPRTAMLVMEMLTGRRVSECDIDNFTWLDHKQPETRDRIKKTYKILDESIIDEYSWVDFLGQRKIKNVERRKELIEEGKIKMDLTFPIPLLFKISESEFKYWGDMVKLKVSEGNIARDLPVDFWDSHVGGVRRLRGYTEQLHKRLLPDLAKAHNFRAIYGNIISGKMVDYCNVSDKVKLMTIMLGHADGKSTEKYRIIRVINEKLTVEKQEIISNLEEIIHELETMKGLYGGRVKSKVEFVDWSATDKKHYSRYLKDKTHFDNLKVITGGTVDFTQYSSMSGSEYRKSMDEIFELLEKETGFSYRFLTTRYTECIFSVVYALAKKVYSQYSDKSKQTLKKEMDKAYANYKSNINTIEEEQESVYEHQY